MAANHTSTASEPALAPTHADARSAAADISLPFVNQIYVSLPAASPTLLEALS